MNKLDEKLKQIKSRGCIGFMTHVVVGYPTVKDTGTLVKTMAKYADVIELQIPFSDPLADGPTIMKACEESIKNGTKVSDAFKVMKELTEYFDRHPGKRSASRISYDKDQRDSGQARMTIGVGDDREKPALLFMAYYNTVFTYGTEKFVKDAATAGASGLIVPDMPLDEEAQEHFYAYCKKYSLHAIHVVSPASSDERLQKNAKRATGFVYATARQGITGVKDSGLRMQDLRIFLERVRKHFSIPVAVGFGIFKKEQIDSLASYADIAVIGSALIDVVNNSKNIEKGVKDFLTTVSVVE